MTRYVALYCRLSPRPDGSYEGVEDQEKWGRDYAASAWPGLPVEVFADAGISASNDDYRPEYERLRQAIRDGQVAHVWTVEQTRLERREVPWFQLAAELDAAGINDVHTNRDGVVRVRDDVAGIKAVLAAGEIRRLKRRINDRLAEIAAAGIPSGTRPFGYLHATDDSGQRTYDVVPEQAAAIRQAAEWVLAGWSLTNAAREFGKRGLSGAHGGKITCDTVKRMVTNPTIAGLRVHRGRVVSKGNWPPILDEQTWQAVRTKLSAPRIVDRVDGGTYAITSTGLRSRRRYLLTGGVAVCGVCKAPLLATMKQLHGRTSKPYYLCHPNKGGQGCVGILGLELEEHVADRLCDELDKPEFREALAADDHAARRDELSNALDSLERQRDELAAMWATPGELTSAEWRTARRTIEEHEQQLRIELAALPPPAIDIDPAEIRGAWGHMTLDERREIIAMFVDHVTVKSARLGAKRFDPGRVDIEWRTR